MTAIFSRPQCVKDLVENYDIFILVFNLPIILCCQLHKMGHGQHLDLKINMDVLP